MLTSRYDNDCKKVVKTKIYEQVTEIPCTRHESLTIPRAGVQKGSNKRKNQTD